LVGFGICGIALKFANDPLPPLLIGFILGGMMEDNFARAVQLYGGISFIWERPMTLGLLIIAVTLIFLPGMRAMYARLRADGVADGD
jgi:putative tricarboxylic transport membrane protein